MNDSKENVFKTKCDHSHTESCSKCEDLKDVLHSIESSLDQLTVITENEQDSLSYTYHSAVQDIQAWKAHQLRSVRQDEARTCILDDLDEASVHITQDWAMKFLPQKYRETQSDWFGKRGISGHISVVARKEDEKLQTQAFVHIVQNCNQDGYVVVQLIEHVLRALKNEHPELLTAFLRQDNAACYHSTVMLETCSYMAAKTGIAVGRVDFSDPQGGKGACDRKAAPSRHMCGDTSTRDTTYKLQLSLKRPCCRLAESMEYGLRLLMLHAASGNKAAGPEARWDGVSSLNNFQYSGSQITVWRAYNVGKGKVVKRKAQTQGKYTYNFITLYMYMYLRNIKHFPC